MFDYVTKNTILSVTVKILLSLFLPSLLTFGALLVFINCLAVLQEIPPTPGRCALRRLDHCRQQDRAGERYLWCRVEPTA